MNIDTGLNLDRMNIDSGLNLDEGLDLDAPQVDASGGGFDEQEQLRAAESQEPADSDITSLPAGSGYVWQGPNPQLLTWWDCLTPSCRDELCGLQPGDVLSRSTMAALTAGGLACPQTVRAVGRSAVRMSIASRATIQQVRMAHATRISHGASCRWRGDKHPQQPQLDPSELSQPGLSRPHGLVWTPNRGKASSAIKWRCPPVERRQ